uniref:Uncharacterized protein n=1 Tax=virus sp. ctmTa7 TaxID=2828255 RepID=A0A8S5RC94_9VIRU|nr:MAG TPA: hypothetical protein [virus sp. ctmTa7]
MNKLRSTRIVVQNGSIKQLKHQKYAVLFLYI